MGRNEEKVHNNGDGLAGASPSGSFTISFIKAIYMGERFRRRSSTGQNGIPVLERRLRHNRPTPAQKGGSKHRMNGAPCRMWDIYGLLVIMKLTMEVEW